MPSAGPSSQNDACVLLRRNEVRQGRGVDARTLAFDRWRVTYRWPQTLGPAVGSGTGSSPLPGRTTALSLPSCRSPGVG